ncbi:MAG: hypothetical protein NT133_00005, partial [Alphaproteobacteria bacterium]|nr:hypothetical protein [Alphaproteobacteria bacterium]
LDRTSVSDLSALQGLTQLQRLYLDRTSVSDLSALQGLTQLRELSLDRTSVSDLSALSDLIAKGLTVEGKDDLLERLNKP